MTLYPESFVKDRLYIKFSNVKKAEWNVTIKRETKYSEKYSKDEVMCYNMSLIVANNYMKRGVAYILYINIIIFSTFFTFF
jgi:restriction endonuclease S subunit